MSAYILMFLLIVTDVIMLIGLLSIMLKLSIKPIRPLLILGAIYNAIVFIFTFFYVNPLINNETSNIKRFFLIILIACIFNFVTSVLLAKKLKAA